MTQNIYDHPEFFEGYSRLDRSVRGLGGAPEWPCLRSMLPDLSGRRVLDLGCGYGWFSRWARGQGATRVFGIDLSENMLKRAAELTVDDGIEYRRDNLETIQLSNSDFDLVFSSLVLHYIDNLARLFQCIHRALVVGGHFVFSTEHSIYTAPRRPYWSIDETGTRSWPVDGYLSEGRRETEWLAKGVIKQHRSIGTIINLLISAGFSIARLEEWGPTDEQIASQPELSEHRERPMFLLVAAQRKGLDFCT